MCVCVSRGFRLCPRLVADKLWQLRIQCHSSEDRLLSRQLTRQVSIASLLRSMSCSLNSAEFSLSWAAWSLPYMCMVQGSASDSGRIYTQNVKYPLPGSLLPGLPPSFSTGCGDPSSVLWFFKPLGWLPALWPVAIIVGPHPVPFFPPSVPPPQT